MLKIKGFPGFWNLYVILIAIFYVYGVNVPISNAVVDPEFAPASCVKGKLKSQKQMVFEESDSHLCIDVLRPPTSHKVLTILEQMTNTQFKMMKSKAEMLSVVAKTFGEMTSPVEVTYCPKREQTHGGCKGTGKSVVLMGMRNFCCPGIFKESCSEEWQFLDPDNNRLEWFKADKVAEIFLGSAQKFKFTMTPLTSSVLIDSLRLAVKASKDLLAASIPNLLAPVDSKATSFSQSPAEREFKTIPNTNTSSEVVAISTMSDEKSMPIQRALSGVETKKDLRTLDAQRMDESKSDYEKKNFPEGVRIEDLRDLLILRDSDADAVFRKYFPRFLDEVKNNPKKLEKFLTGRQNPDKSLLEELISTGNFDTVSFVFEQLARGWGTAQQKYFASLLNKKVNGKETLEDQAVQLGVSLAKKEKEPELRRVKGESRESGNLSEIARLLNYLKRESEGKRPVNALHDAVRDGQKNLADWLIRRGNSAASLNLEGSTPFHYAVKRKDGDQWIELLTRNMEPDQLKKVARTTDHSGKSVFRVALENKRSGKEIVERFLKADLELIGADEIISAADSGNKELVQFFLEKRPFSSFSAEDQNSLYFHFTSLSQQEKLREWTKMRPELAGIQDSEGDTPLHRSLKNIKKSLVGLMDKKGSGSQKDREATVTFLMEDKSSFRKLNHKKQIPLDIAIGAIENEDEKADFTDQFLQKASVQLLKKMEQEPLETLQEALERGAWKTAKWMIQSVPEFKKLQDGKSELHLLAANKRDEDSKIKKTDLARMILLKAKNSEDLNNVLSQEAQKETALLTALRSGNEDTARLLLSAGSSLEAKNSDGQNPFHLAMKLPTFDMGQRMLAFMVMGKNLKPIFQKDSSGKTPLDYAGNHIDEILETLNQSDVTDVKGNTALDLAVEYKSKDWAMRLIDEQKKDGKGSVDLYFDAIARNNNTTADWLIQESKLPLIQEGRQDNRKTLFHLLAARRGFTAAQNERIINRLFEASIELKGRDQNNQALKRKLEVETLNKKDAQGLSPLHIAAQSGQLELLKVLIRKGGNPRQKTGRFGLLGKSALDFLNQEQKKEILAFIKLEKNKKR